MTYPTGISVNLVESSLRPLGKIERWEFLANYHIASVTTQRSDLTKNRKGGAAMLEAVSRWNEQNQLGLVICLLLAATQIITTLCKTIVKIFVRKTRLTHVVDRDLHRLYYARMTGHISLGVGCDCSGVDDEETPEEPKGSSNEATQ